MERTGIVSYRRVTPLYSSPSVPTIRGVSKRLEALGQHYEIVSIKRAEPPPDGKGSNWYRYVIAFEGSNTITGCRAGSLNAVTSGVVEMVAQLNERHFKNRGRADFAPKK